jgi:hypothetical protein
MRACVLALVAAGCLATPPGPQERAAGRDAGAPVEVDDAGDPVPDCDGLPRIDLAYVNRVGLSGDGAGSQIALSDIAVIVNPGSDPLVADHLYAAVRSVPGVFAGVQLTARDGTLALPPGQAHGALAVDYATRVLTMVTEEWTDYSFPVLETDFMIEGALAGETDIVLELVIEGQRLEAPLTLVPYGSHFALEALDAARITASCGD